MSFAPAMACLGLKRGRPFVHIEIGGVGNLHRRYAGAQRKLSLLSSSQVGRNGKHDQSESRCVEPPALSSMLRDNAPNVSSIPPCTQATEVCI
jgi:hypothetical protein